MRRSSSVKEDRRRPRLSSFAARLVPPAAGLAHGTLTDATLTGLARRHLSRDASREQVVRHAEIRRLAVAVLEAGRALKTNRAQLQAIVDDLAPGLTDRRGLGPVTAAQVIVSFSHPGRCRNDAAFAALAGVSPLEASSGLARTRRTRLTVRLASCTTWKWFTTRVA